MGITTNNGFIYKPGEGARGNTEKSVFDAGLDRVDARLGKEIWVGDPNCGATLQDAITAIGSNNVILRVPAGTHVISSDLTIPANIILRPERGVILSVATTKTLTINGFLEAGCCQVFSCTGTGKVLFGPGAVKEIYTEWWGGSANNSTKNDAAMASAITSLSLHGGAIKLNSGTYLFDAEVLISPPVSYIKRINIVGSGMFATMMKWTAATNGIRIDGATGDTTIVASGSIRELTLHGNDIALDGVTAKDIFQFELDRVFVEFFVRRGVYIHWCITPKLSHCLFTANGGTGYAQIEVDRSTTFLWEHCYMSGHSLAHVPDCGMKIDGTGPSTLIGGAIESTGIPIKICSKSEGTYCCMSCTLMNVNFENPGDGNPYIEAGYGWTGANGGGVQKLVLINNSFSGSGTTSCPYPIKLKHTTAFNLVSHGGAGNVADTVAFIKFEGTTNRYASWSPWSGPTGINMVELNGLIRPDANPSQPWTMEGTGEIIRFTSTLTIDAAEPEVFVPLPGGVQTANTTATVINSITPIGGIIPYHGQSLYVMCEDSHTSIAHNAVTHTGFKIFTPTAGTVALSIGRIYKFIYNGNHGIWVMMNQ